MSKKNWRVLKELFRLRFHGLTVFRFDFFCTVFLLTEVCLQSNYWHLESYMQT